MSTKPLKNPRHEAFARHYVQHGIARHAYIAAGYQSRCDDIGGSTPADACASRLLRHAKVKPRIERLQQAMAKLADITADTIATELEEARQLALKEGQSAAAVSATTAKAKLAGLMIERRENGDAGDFARMTEEQLREYIRDNQDTPSSMPTPTHAEHKSEQ